MNPHLVIVIVGLFYIVLFGGMSLLRREGLSNQFAFEVLGITTLVVIIGLLTGATVQPLLFLILIYLISMRARILVDLANLLSARGRQRDAIKLLQWALRLYPDQSSRLIILVNMGIVQLRRQNPESAQALFEMVLEEAESGRLGYKYEAACHYNLALALQRQGKDAEAVRQFNETVEVFPNSIFAKGAERALEQRRQGKVQSGEPPGDAESEEYRRVTPTGDE